MIIVQIIDESLWKNEALEVKETLFFQHFLSFFWSSCKMGAEQPAACSATTNPLFLGDKGMNFAVTHTVVDETRRTRPPGWQQSASKINIVK